ncbi:MAG: hypothetical protein R3C03_17045 [Pirellulaceae bacterium]
MAQVDSIRFALVSLLLMATGLFPIALQSGCKSWKEHSGENASPLQRAGLPPNTIALEVVLAQLPASEMDDIKRALEPYLDRQAVSIDYRRPWNENGLVVGTFHSTWPGVLQDALKSKREETLKQVDKVITREQLDAINTPDPVKMHKQTQFTNGEPRTIPMTDFLDVARWTAIENGVERTRTENTVRSWFQIISKIERGTSAQITLTPMVSFGPILNGVGVVDHELAFRQKQREVLYADLAVNVSLSAGETIVIYSNANEGELGDLLLGNSNGLDADQERILLLRLVRTQDDDLFELKDF